MGHLSRLEVDEIIITVTLQCRTTLLQQQSLSLHDHVHHVHVHFTL
jgi:hypothetical protein